MANTFKLDTSAAVGTTATSVYTCPASTATTIIGLNVANVLLSDITIDVEVVNNDGDRVYLVKNAPVPTGSSIVAVGGDQKVVLEESDSLEVSASSDSAADVVLSLLEIS